MFLTIEYHGYWLHMTVDRSGERWRIQSPDYSVRLYAYRTLEGAKRRVRRLIREG